MPGLTNGHVRPLQLGIKPWPACQGISSSGQSGSPRGKHLKKNKPTATEFSPSKKAVFGPFSFVYSPPHSFCQRDIAVCYDVETNVYRCPTVVQSKQYPTSQLEEVVQQGFRPDTWENLSLVSMAMMCGSSVSPISCERTWNTL